MHVFTCKIDSIEAHSAANSTPSTTSAESLLWWVPMRDVVADALLHIRQELACKRQQTRAAVNMSAVSCLHPAVRAKPPSTAISTQLPATPVQHPPLNVMTTRRSPCVPSILSTVQ